MALEVTMPKFGLTMHEGTIQRFFKNAGESIAQGEPLFEVETEKVLYEVEAPASGTFALALCAEGDTLECGVAVAVIAEPGESVAAVAARYGAASAARSDASEAAAANAAASAAAPALSAGGGRRAASPVARKLAQELGVDLERVTGTGPGGRITREDVERAPPG
ncbi:MAG TPA: E3 binding domain-containing protein, partial [Candidatus Binataceae bacterium]